MSHWQAYNEEDTYYILVDSKPAEVIDPNKFDTIFCTAFVSTASCFRGVKSADLPWFKQYKECESLEESIFVIDNLRILILEQNFLDLYVWILSSKYSDIDRNGLNFLKGILKEVPDLDIDETHFFYGKRRYKLEKAKMLIWFNYCLCCMAPSLVDMAIRWKQKKAIFHVDRLGDSDKRVFEFMRMVMEDTSMRNLWHRCTEDHDKKPEYVGYVFPSHFDANGKLIPAQNSMQSSLVDWIVLAAYAAKNGLENRDEVFHNKLVDLIKLLDRLKLLNGVEIKGNIIWT